MLVNSGWGVHAYWSMTADMAPHVWKTTAEALKRALAAEGILSDPSRTADEASVLRAPGTHNRKSAVKTVNVVRAAAQFDLAVMQAPLMAYVSATPADPFAHLGPAPAGLLASSSDLTAGAGFDPSSALLIADQCAIMGMMRDTRGNIDQPTWYGALGVLAQTTEAPDIVHAWSTGHPLYSKAETDTKLSQAAQYPPTTCEKLGEQHHQMCAACPHFGKIKSPIVLGRPRIETVSVEPQIKTSTGFIKAAPIDLPHGYGVETTAVGRKLTYTKHIPAKGEEPARNETTVVCDTFLTAVTRLWSDGEAKIEFQADKREGPHNFILANSTIGKGGAELNGHLAAQEIVARKGHEVPLQGYLKGWITHLKNNAEQVMAHKSFGWVEGSFVLGEIVYNADGSEGRAILDGEAAKRKGTGACSGDLDTWVALVDRAYNAPGQEPWQFQIACAFAAPLLSLMDQVDGVTVYAHSSGSGAGKTTVQRVGLSAWGNHRSMMLTKVTPQALLTILGSYNSLPVVYDELTNADSGDISEMVFSVSSGQPKERLDLTGVTRDNNTHWSTIMMASGNTLLSQKLTQHRANAEAEMSRLFEFTLPRPKHLTAIEANEIFPQFSQHYGHAGVAYAKYIAKNRSKLVTSLNRTQASLTSMFEMTPTERYWSALFASVVVALVACRDIGLLEFEINPIVKWMKEQLAMNRVERVEASPEPQDHIGQMLFDLWEGVLGTAGGGDLRATRGIDVRIEHYPRGPIIGRYIDPILPNERPQLWVSRAAINKWANTRGVSANEMLRAAVDLGWCPEKSERCSFGKGVRGYNTGTMTVPCWKFNPAALEGGVLGEKIQQLKAIKGGKP
jgi:hypothetical protein